MPPDAQHHEHGEVAAQGTPAPAAQGQGDQGRQRGEGKGGGQAVAQRVVARPREHDGQNAPAPDGNNQQTEQQQTGNGGNAGRGFSHRVSALMVGHQLLLLACLMARQHTSESACFKMD
ncbi:hypothetical protein D3C78_784430 [compost metagenome]